MYNLLQGNEKRQLRLAELLIYTGDWITLKELAQKLNCSERILKYDLVSFKEIFQDFTIETSHHGVRLIFEDNKGLKNIYLNLFDSSNAFRFLEAIFFNETYSVNELATKLYISPSTLYRVIHQINQVVKDNNYHIETNPCRISGAEDSIRYFYYQFFYEKYTILTWPYNQLNNNMINDLLYFFMDLTEFKADFAYYNIAQLMLFVNLSRYKKEHFIFNENSNVKDVLAKLNVSSENMDYFERRYKLKVNDDFILQMFSPFVNDGFAFNYDQFLEKIETNEKVAIEVGLLRSLLDELSQTNNIPISNKEEVVFELHNTSTIEDYDPRSGHILYNRNKLFAEAIQRDFPDFYNQLYEGIKQYRITIGLSDSEKNTNFLVYILFTEWKNLIIELYQQHAKVKVLVISNRNRAHSYMLKDFLMTKFATQIIIEVYDDTLVTKRILENLAYDFIIANFPIPKLRNKDSVYIENFPNQNEINQIQKKIDRILSKTN